MPHTSRRHRKPAPNHGKRIQITDDDGWVHVVNSAQTTTRPKKQPSRYITTDGSSDDHTTSPFSSSSNPNASSSHQDKILPAEAPPRLTLSALRLKFDADLAAWQSSGTWQLLKESLVRILSTVLNSPNGDSSKITNVVCIGLGSPSGLRDGWVDRRDVASFQLAALVSLIELLNEQQFLSSLYQEKKEELDMKFVAQDPIFNTLDKQLLSSLGISVVNSPDGFTAVSANTLLFAPGAEKRHLEMLLPMDPVLVFGGPLEEHAPWFYTNESHDHGKGELKRFLEGRESVQLAEFGPKPEAFWRMRVYWRNRYELR
ncbi:hypothetical protein BGW36DRAFT_371434 [Talaromyces proteolyticus]|uniref:SRR1-like domain-containing protein n=1 Tax=Talaromyces proteolyticus TaxID=1131652 RepID=A0AAD4KXQ3_9EURO|nr:uncharacterized protein BGW36DRAFT_371434 [Talaromyces proteolyticus]KAH8701733.1 hypothetical protein BGW36DRAFT_371434 [Talaromyces proteolyticus]